MFDGTDIMFGKFGMRLGKVKKKDYENHYNSFFEENNELFSEMFDYISARDDKKAAAEEIAVIVYDNLGRQHGNRKGKLSKSLCIDLSMYMLYYMYPAILKMDNENSTVLADALRDEWRVRSNNPSFDYASYEDIYKGFKEKLFGFF